MALVNGLKRPKTGVLKQGSLSRKTIAPENLLRISPPDLLTRSYGRSERAGGRAPRCPHPYACNTRAEGTNLFIATGRFMPLFGERTKTRPTRKLPSEKKSIFRLEVFEWPFQPSATRIFSPTA